MRFYIQRCEWKQADKCSATAAIVACKCVNCNKTFVDFVLCVYHRRLRGRPAKVVICRKNSTRVVQVRIINKIKCKRKTMHRWKTTNMLDRIGWKRHWGKAKLVSSDDLVDYLNFFYLTLEQGKIVVEKSI